MERFTDRSDLVDFKKQRVTCFILKGFFDTKSVCNSEIVPIDLIFIVSTPCWKASVIRCIGEKDQEKKSENLESLVPDLEEGLPVVDELTI